MKKIQFEILFCILGCVVEGQNNPTYIVVPQNTAGKIGDEVKLYTTLELNAASGITIVLQPEDLPSSTLYNSERAQDVDQRFKIEEIAGQEEGKKMYNITILSLAENSAGEYTIQPNPFNSDVNDGLHRHAHVAALEEEVCTKSKNTAEEGTTVTITCEVEYYGDLRPMLRLSNSYDGIISGSLNRDDTSRPKKVSLTYDMIARKQHDGIDHTCMVMFTGDSLQDINDSPEYSNAVPSHTQHCMVSFEVEHEPDDPQIYPQPMPDAVSPGTMLHCEAGGNPVPQYTWDCGTGQPMTGQNLTIPESWVRDDVYNCRCITNQPGASLRESSVQFRVTQSGSAGAGGGGGGSNGGPIAAGIIIPLLIIIIAIIVIICCWRKHKSRADDKPKPEPSPQPNPGYQPSMTDLHKQPVSPYPQGPPPPATGILENGAPVKGSPGMADLGVKHISASNPSLNASFNSLNRSRDYNPPTMSFPQTYDNGDTTV